MKLHLQREPSNDICTMGILFVDGHYFCHTLEDVVRETKIQGVTAIPSGTYAIIIAPSPRFKRMLPHLLNVPNFEGILIHPGNWANDTEGCILVGRDRGKNSVLASRVVFNKLFDRMSDSIQRGEKVSITICDALV